MSDIESAARRAESEPTTKLVSYQDTEIVYLGGMDDSLMADCVSISECSSCGRIVVETPQRTYYGQPADCPFDSESLWAIMNYCPHCGAKVVSE